jgi:UDP:flavonoid glycosyltransferase YjiC (YdhE family)
MKVLIAPLDWGLGHATRCVPIIRALRAAGHEVIPCASGAGLRLLRAEFPDLDTRALPSYAMRYTKSRALLPLWLLLQLPLFLLSAWRDARAAARLARETGAGLVISDGRYGFRAAAVPAVFVSHQLDILPPGPRALRALLRPALRALNRRALRGFREVWVPDFPGLRNLSGALGHPRYGSGEDPSRILYIHPLCRFRPDDFPWDRAFAPPDPAPAIDVLALLSGPEPQRTLLEEILVHAFEDLPGTRVIVRGLPRSVPGGLTGTVPSDSVFQIQAGLNVFDHLPQERLLACLVGARHVVCRSGYTTMMELAGLGKGNVLLVPTPGQPEQEYLAAQARGVGLAAWRDQDALRTSVDIAEGLREAETLPGFGALFTVRATGTSAPGGDWDLAGWIRRHPLLQGRVSL